MDREQIRHDARSTRSPRQLEAGSDRRAMQAAQAGAAESATRQSVRKGLISMLVAATVLLVFDSAGLRSWAGGLPGNAATDLLVEGADRWHSMMTHAGLAAAMAAVQDAVAAFRHQAWPDPGIISTGEAGLSRDD